MEFVKDPKPDLVLRMVKYWMRVRECYPKDPIAQYLLVLGVAVARISAGAEADRAQALLGAAATLASVVLPRRIIGDVLKEAAVPVLVRDTSLGREIYDEGRQEGKRAVLGALLRQRFGDDPRIDDVVERLSGLPDEDGLARLAAAGGLDELDC